MAYVLFEYQHAIQGQHRDSHHKDKTVSRLSYPYNGNPYTWKDGLFIETDPGNPVQSTPLPNLSLCPSAHCKDPTA